MRIRRLVAVIGLTLALATPALAQLTQAAQAKKGGGGKPKDEKVWVARMMINDLYTFGGVATRLLSDMMWRTGDDDNDDGVLDLVAGPPSAVYQDRLLPEGAVTPFYPDPCVSTGLVERDGWVNVDLERGQGASFKNCVLLDDPLGARTLHLKFEKDSCECNTFKYLAESAATNPWREPYGTGYFEDDDYCTVTPAAGGILTVREQQLTGNPRITSHPFAQIKKKGVVQPATHTNMVIAFNVDQPEKDDIDSPSLYSVRSLSHDLPITPDPNDPDTRTVSASTQLFELNVTGSNFPVCSGFELPLQVTFKRFDIATSQQ